MKLALPIFIAISTIIFATNVNADCAARIEAVKNHPLVIPAEASKDGDTAAVIVDGGVTTDVNKGKLTPSAHARHRPRPIGLACRRVQRPMRPSTKRYRNLVGIRLQSIP